MNGYQYTYKDDFRLKSIQTALGYSNVQVDLYQVIWLQKREDEWEVVSENWLLILARTGIHFLYLKRQRLQRVTPESADF